MTNVINYDYDYLPILQLQLLFNSAITVTQNKHVFFECYNRNSETHK